MTPATALSILVVWSAMFAGSQAAAQAGQPAPRLTAHAALQAIKAEGAAKVIERFFAEPKTEEALLDGIGTGGVGWLQVAAGLRPSSDAGASFAMNVAIQDALPQNPEGVLRLVGQGVFSLKEACGGWGRGQIEDTRSPSVVRRLIRRREEAVARVRVVSLAKERDACLATLGDLVHLVSVR